MTYTVLHRGGSSRVEETGRLTTTTPYLGMTSTLNRLSPTRVSGLQTPGFITSVKGRCAGKDLDPKVNKLFNVHSKTRLITPTLSLGSSVSRSEGPRKVSRKYTATPSHTH